MYLRYFFFDTLKMRYDTFIDTEKKYRDTVSSDTFIDTTHPWLYRNLACVGNPTRTVKIQRSLR